MTVDKYILDGHNAVPIHDLFEWGKWFETAERHVAQDEPIPDVRVRTVFLGLDQSFGDGPPLLFKTMVFGGELDQEQDRYSTWDEAERGHAAMVERVKRSQPQTEGGASHESTPQVREKGAGERARELVRKTLCADCADGVPYSDDRKMSHIIPNPTKRKHRPCKAWFEADVLEKPLAGALAAVRLDTIEEIAVFAETHYCVIKADAPGGYKTETRAKHPNEPFARAIRALAGGERAVEGK